MKPILRLANKGTITQLFSGNHSIYSARGANGHTGIDTFLGWNALITADNPGLIYKTFTAGQSKENWRAIYQLVLVNEDTYVEVCMGHFNEVLVKEGQWVPAQTPLGREGNKGYVFSGGKEVTPAMQEAGDKRGAHTHISYRPVKRVPKITKGRHYLETRAAVPYRDAFGNYYEVTHKDNGFRGCVDPLIYKYEPTRIEHLLATIAYLQWLLQSKK